jgi:hypothetical protein
MPPRKIKSDGTENVHTTSGSRKVSVVLPPALAARVERLADVRGERLTTVVVKLIEAGERQTHEDLRTDALASLRTELLSLVGDLGQQVRREVQGQAHRLSHLLARTALESMAARNTSGQILFKLYGDQDRARELYASGWTQAVERLKNPSPGVRQSLNEVAASSGELEPGLLSHLAHSTQELRSTLAAVPALAEQVAALEEQEHATQTQLTEVQNRIRQMQQAVLSAVASLNHAEEEFRNKPKGLFNR